ncbi:MAG: ABC transporter permease subunit [Oscillospiraceae bacterium]|nr:ABC transporter permease subunit [Oscillospiraceae bacterium]
MRRFITSLHNLARRKWPQRLLAALFWLAVWQIAAVLAGREIVLVPPWRVAVRLTELARTAAFWQSVGFTLARIAGGFALASLCGVALASLSAWKGWIHALARPFISLVQSTPVASFTIIALIWVRASSLSVLVSFLMSLPIFYTGTLEGIRRVDGRLLEMARLFEVPRARQIAAIYAPGVRSYLLSAATGALGIAWKAGVSAEVIGLPSGSIGQRLQQAKLFLETADLFAWTAVIVILSASMEALLRRAAGKGGGTR